MLSLIDLLLHSSQQLLDFIQSLLEQGVLFHCFHELTAFTIDGFFDLVDGTVNLNTQLALKELLLFLQVHVAAIL